MEERTSDRIGLLGEVDYDEADVFHEVGQMAWRRELLVAAGVRRIQDGEQVKRLAPSGA